MPSRGHLPSSETDHEVDDGLRLRTAVGNVPQWLLRMQAGAGNRAATAFVAQRRADGATPVQRAEVTPEELGVSSADAVDSEPPVAAPSGTGEGAAPGDLPPEEASVQRQPVVQRDGRLCSPYNGYSAPIPVATYNCAGLAHRTYDYKSLTNTRALLAGGRSIGAAAKCSAGQVKHWLWEYDVRLEDSSGNRTPPSADFHTVAGVSDSGGNDPTDVYSKNGARPIYGPGTGPSFRPVAREQARENNPQEKLVTDNAGRPIYKIRENMVESCYCLACPSTTGPIQGPPAP